jgi:PhnB protein
VDPWGHRWSVASHVEDVTPEEMERRAAEMQGGSGG